MPSSLAHGAESSETRAGTQALLLTPLVLLALTASAHADPLFLAPFLSFDAGSGPSSVAIADLNADAATHIHFHVDCHPK